MSKDVIFKTFRTYRHPYVYDRHTNSIIMLTEDEYSELLRVEKGELPHAQSPVIKKYQESGMLMPNVVEKIEHAWTEIIEHHLKTRLRQLILQVTQQCNLRCEYCTYSGIYNGNRTHSNQRMSWETAKKAIGFFLSRNSEMSQVHIGFYGGEPLLEFNLIKQCVEYVKSQVEGKKVSFNITTNATLLSDTVVDYLIENNFTLSVSLDGSKEEHDMNRKFANGEGSFEVVIDNIKRIQKRHSGYDKIGILTTINPHIDLGCVLEFFNANEVLNDKYIIFNSMKESNLKKDLPYNKKFYIVRNYEYIKMLFSLVGKLETKYVSKLVLGSRSILERELKSIYYHLELPPIMHHGGPCMPGVQRLFVRVDGVLFPCERVSEVMEYFKIGTLEGGVDVTRIRKILNIGKLTENECKNCISLRQCNLCAGEIEFDTEPSKESKLKECLKSKKSAFNKIYELCVLSEFGLDLDEMRLDK